MTFFVFLLLSSGIGRWLAQPLSRRPALCAGGCAGFNGPRRAGPWVRTESERRSRR